MKKTFLALLLISFVSLNASADLTENFETGTLSSAPGSETQVTLQSGNWTSKARISNRTMAANEWL